MDLVLQMMIVGLSQAAIYGLVAMGFGLVLSVSRVFHFAHGAVLTLAAFFTYAFIVQLGLPLWLSYVLAAAGTMVIGLLIQLFVYAPLKRRNSSLFSLALSAIGLQFWIESMIGLIWGTGGHHLPNPFAAISFSFGQIVLPLADAITVAVAILGFVATLLFLHLTLIGKAMMAYADNPTMAEIVGIRPAMAGAVAMVIACLLVTPAAIAIGWYSSLVPFLGLEPLLYSLAAVVVGGIGSLTGVFLAAFLLGLLSAAVSLELPAFWADTIAFMIMMAMIMVRPSGFAGKRIAAKSVR